MRGEAGVQLVSEGKVASVCEGGGGAISEGGAEVWSKVNEPPPVGGALKVNELLGGPAAAPKTKTEARWRF